MSDGESGVNQYADAESMVPFGELLMEVRGTEKAVHVGYYREEKGKRDHRWIAHLPDHEEGRGEFLSVRISTNVGQVTYVDFETASGHLQEPGLPFQDYDLVVRDVVDIDRTPIPYKKERTVSVECPECERFGTTHPWKLEDYVPDVCACGYRGEYNVS